MQEDRGEVMRVDKDMYPNVHLDEILQLKIFNFPIELLAYFLHKKIFVPHDFDEGNAVLDLLRKAEEYNRNNQLPINFHLFITHSCNFRCVYCIQGYKVRRRLPQVMTEDQVRQSFRQAIEICDRIAVGTQPEAITLFGGEPMLPITKSAVKIAVKEANNRNMGVHVVTNGYNYDLFSELFQELASENRISFLVSLDGPPAIHNSRRPLSNGKDTFSKIALNITQMLESGARVVMQPIIDVENIEYLDQLYNLCKEYGWLSHHRFSIKCGMTMFPNAKARDFIPYFSAEEHVLEKLLKTSIGFGSNFSRGLDCGLKPSYFLETVLIKNQPIPIACGCSARRGALSFSPDGFVYPCREYAGWGKEYAIAKYSPKLELFSENIGSWYNFKVSESQKCSKCKHVLICGGGCRVHTETSNNNLENPLCPNFDDLWTIFLKTFDSIMH